MKYTFRNEVKNKKTENEGLSIILVFVLEKLLIHLNETNSLLLLHRYTLCLMLFIFNIVFLILQTHYFINNAELTEEQKFCFLLLQSISAVCVFKHCAFKSTLNMTSYLKIKQSSWV